MATILGVPRACNTKVGYTGQPTCDTKIQKLTMLILAYDGFVIPAAELTTFEDALAYLQAATIAALPKNRVYPIKTVEGLTDNTEAAEVIKSGYGNPQYSNEKPHTFEIDTENLGIGYYKNLRKFKGQKNLRAFWVDTTFIGGQKNANGDLVPFECTFDAKQVKVGDGGGTITKNMVDFSLKRATALSDDIEQIVFDEDYDLANDLYGVLGVELSSPAAWVVKAKEMITKSDLYDSYADALAVTGAWKATNAVTGAVIAVSTVVKSATYKGWTITLATVTAADITLVDPTALAAINVGSTTAGGYETEGGVRLGE
jgi:hypothetical protein